RHDALAEAAPLVRGEHGDVDDLEEEPAIADDASHRDGLPCLADGDAVPGVREADARSLVRLAAEAALAAPGEALLAPQRPLLARRARVRRGAGAPARARARAPARPCARLRPRRIARRIDRIHVPQPPLPHRLARLRGGDRARLLVDEPPLRVAEDVALEVV